jgi:Bifunctional DNA primase/polymerase, N-terminal
MSIPPEIEAVALLGWRIYPCSRVSRAGMFKGAHLAATHDLNVIAGWCKEYNRANWRVIVGGSGIWALDVDSNANDTHQADGIAALRSLVAEHGALPPRPMTRSGGGGYALFFSHNAGEKISGKTGVPMPGIDPRRGALSVTIPPSIHIVTKRPYRWLSKPWEVTPPPAPPWLLALVEPPPEPVYQRAPIDTTDQARALLYRAAVAVMNATNGQRNDVLNRRSYQAGRMVAGGLVGEQEAINVLYGAAREAGLPGREIMLTIRSGIASGMRKGAGG